MGATIDAWIEYDETVEWLHHYPERANDPPFSHPIDGCIPLRDYDGFRESKDYRFYAALSGDRRLPDDPEPLFAARGVPPHISCFCADDLKKLGGWNDPRLSWLTLTEIRQALAHIEVNSEHIATETYIVLDIMQLLEKRFGVDRVRLIFLIK